MSALPDPLRARLAAAGARPVDIALADWGWRHGGGQAGALGLALASHAISLGHSCLPLSPADEEHGATSALIDTANLAGELADNPLVGSAEQPDRPLIVEGGRLYLQRYRAYECRLAACLRALLATEPASVDPAPLAPEGGLFSRDWAGTEETDWQAVAALVAQRHRLAVISGGPGTGKTYTVVRLMLRLIEAALAAGRQPPACLLAAPTGKAAARMQASVAEGLAQLQPAAAIRQHLPAAATTLHRLLRLRRGTTLPGHDRDRPLPADVVIVDEASMVDLPLMTKLVEALPANARLILLGDRYQLASVESGSVLADLAAPAGVNAFSRAQHAAAGPLLAGHPPAAAPTALSDHVVTLQTSHRFHADSEIGQLAAAINAGDGDAALGLLQPDSAEIRACMAVDEASLDGLVTAVAADCAPLHQAKDRETALAALEGFRLLTGTRIGPAGSDSLNARITRALARRYGFSADSRWYHGRPVIILQNEPRAGLYNGDVGIVWHEDHGRTRVCFRTEAGLRQFHPSVLPAHETAYAMTIHKSQGSEFDRVFLLLPPARSRILTRELLYTAVTRARQTLSAWGEAQAWRAGIEQRLLRHSGLAERILGRL